MGMMDFSKNPDMMDFSKNPELYS